MERITAQMADVEPTAAASSSAPAKRKKEDKEFVYERQGDDEGTLEEEEKLDQGDVKVKSRRARRAFSLC